MRGRSKVRIATNKTGPVNAATASKDGNDTGTASETEERKRIRQVKRRADNLRSQANRLTSIARNTHAVSCKPLAFTRCRPTQGEEPRACSTRHTDLAFKTSSVKLGYALGDYDNTLEGDADDGGQQYFNDYLKLDIYSVNSCPTLLRIAAKSKDLAASWDATN